MTGSYFTPPELASLIAEGTTYEPAAGTGGLLLDAELFTNPPFAIMPTSDRQDAIETACHNAIRAMHDQAAIAHREGRSPEACLILAGALTQLALQEITSAELSDCMMHLTRLAAPRRGLSQNQQQ